MPKEKPAAGNHSLPLPTDATDIFVVEAETNVTPMIRDSMRARLHDVGALWRLGETQTLLVSRAAYVAALSDFCATVPGVANAIASNQAVAADRARHQNQMDATTREAKRLKGAKVTP